MRLTLGLLLLAGCVGDSPAVTPTTDAGASDATTSPDSGRTDSATEAGVDAATWSPSNLGSELVLWLDGDKGVSVGDAGTVASWTDQSKSPVVFTGGAALTDLSDNGHGVVNFNQTGVALYTDSVPKLELGATDDLVIAGVVETIQGVGGLPGAFLWAKTTDKGPINFASPFHGLVFGVDIKTATRNGADLLVYSGDAGKPTLQSTQTPFADKKYHLIVGRRIGGTTFAIRSEGLEETMTLPGTVDVSEPGSSIGIGNVTWGTVTFNGTFAIKIGEILVVRRAGNFSAQDIGHIETYLKQKFNL